ncbi:hypothetical protein MUN82_20535 [Hymenobacter aerilatus]|uniref:Uncharacterized protein n=1 Tax=Hymenobacter aerilatus TaxID=2932251 RepID=A0A8T9SU72_9BACT|nr:hypothetical protein [Hymenobacter aerilatus]UOR05307.1 hypothetical protein MUN82_20535 [Hymenobacter aerilatus]
MVAFRLFLLLIGFLLVAGSSRAQGAPPTPPPPPKEQQELVVRVTVPTAIATLSDYANTLFSKQKDKLKTLTAPRPLRTSNPVIVFTLALPKGWGTKKEKETGP